VRILDNSLGRCALAALNRYDRMSDLADALDARFDDVARPQKFLWRAAGAHTGWRARRDDVTGLERHAGTDVGDQVRNLEQHVAGVGFLLHDAVDGEPQVERVWVLDLIGGDDARSEGGIAVLPLRIDPLPGAAAVARADVDEDAVAEDVLEGVALADPAAGGADDHGELHLPIQLPGDRPVVLDRIVRADDRGRRL